LKSQTPRDLKNFLDNHIKKYVYIFFTKVRNCEMNRTSNRFGASGASLGEELAEALGAIRLVIARCESLSRQGVVAVAASEAISVPRLVLICHAAAGDNLR